MDEGLARVWGTGRREEKGGSGEGVMLGQGLTRGVGFRAEEVAEREATMLGMQLEPAMKV